MTKQVLLSVSHPQTRLSDQEILRLADQCVKCGYCLPHCPTYVKTRNEGRSPRGRIALIQGWVSGALPLSPVMEEHLDTCLVCRACETVCPSLVAYGRLADAAKARRAAAAPAWQRAAGRLSLQALSSARVTNALGRLARAYRATGLARLGQYLGIGRVRAIGLYHRLGVAMAVTARRPINNAPETSDIDLFVGCMGSSAQGAAIDAAMKVCTRLGLSVRIPRDASCCGAMLRHNGHPEAAARAREASARAHAGRALVGLSPSCIAELRGHPGMSHTQELCTFITRRDWPAKLRLKRLDCRVVVHEPCAHRNLLGGTADVYGLLGRIPGLAVAPLAGNDQCCGAAGTYMLQQPQMSGALLDDKIRSLLDAAPDILVTTSPGCALHLTAGIQQAGLAIEVCHPIELIARQLPD